MKNCLFLLFLLFPSLLHAQSRDTLFAIQDGSGWSIRHRVKPGETIFMLARRYYVPPTVLAEANGKTYADGLSTGTTVNIPTGPYNWRSLALSPGSNTRPVYYRLGPGEDFYWVARQAGISKRDLMAQNGLLTDAPPPGKLLFVGWLKFDGSTIPTVAIATNQTVNKPPITSVQLPMKKDTPKYVLQPVLDTIPKDSAVPSLNPGLAALWDEQTLSGTNAITEKVTAGFFSTGKGAAMYAFHNAVARGTVIKVQNLNNGRFIYVKVLGILPTTKAFQGCTLGLSNAAKAALDVRDYKAFCEISYAGY